VAEQTHSPISSGEARPRFPGTSVGFDRFGKWAPEPGVLVVLGHPRAEAQADPRQNVLIDWKRPDDANWKNGTVGEVALDSLILADEALAMLGSDLPAAVGQATLDTIITVGQVS
jgi:hypothetical protein